MPYSIKELEADKLDPEKCIVMLEWKNRAGIECYQYWHNNLTVENVLSLMELSKYKFLNDLDS